MRAFNVLTCLYLFTFIFNKAQSMILILIVSNVIFFFVPLVTHCVFANIIQVELFRLTAILCKAEVCAIYRN